MKPLGGLVTVKLLEDRASIKRYQYQSRSGRLDAFEYLCGEVVTVGFEDTACFTSDDGFHIVQKIPMVVKKGDIVLLHPPDLIETHFKGETFYMVPQRGIYAVIEES